jgi:serine/threonine protein kinase
MYTEENCQDSTNIDNIEFVSKLSYDEGNSLVFLGFHEIYGLCVVKDHLFSSDKIPFHINNEITTQNELKKQNKKIFQNCLNISIKASHVRLVFEYIPHCLNNIMICTQFLRHIIKQLIRTIAELHRIGITHRDIKIDNLCLRSHEVVIIDMDSASNMGQSSIVPITTVITRAPEIFKQQIDQTANKYSNEKIDAWSVAMTILQLALGEPVFQYPETSHPIYMMEAINRLVENVATGSPKIIKAKNRMGTLWEDVFLPLFNTDPNTRKSVIDIFNKIGRE